MDPDEHALVQRMRKRDPASMEILIDRYGIRLRRLVGKLTAWSHDGDDILQEALWKAWNRIDRFRGDGPLEKWLVSIVFRSCRDHQRSAHRRWIRWLRFLEGLPRHSSSPPIEQGEAETSDGMPIAPDDRERWAEMQSAMQRLTNEDRELLVMIHLEHWSHEELAIQMNLSKDRLHVKLHRARQRLRKLLGEI
jgi:RNA polymerase sigma-70 factor (ECF subfamily)